jgi:hypothetical protein
METAETTEVAAGTTEAAAGAREFKLHVEGNANNGRALPYRLAGALCRIGNSYVVRGPNVDIPYNAAVPSTFSTEVLRARWFKGYQVVEGDRRESVQLDRGNGESVESLEGSDPCQVSAGEERSDS